jgi:predicted MFS family arabinose efflux permease
MKIPGGFESLRLCFQKRDYRLYVIGSVSHGLGVWTLRVGMGWLAWEMTESTAWLGGIAMAETAPTLALALIAGTVVDRIDYFKLMRITQGMSLLFAATLAALTLAGLMHIWLLFFMTIFRGCLLAFNRPSRMALIYPLVGRDLLAPALAVSSIIFNGARFIGPAIGGSIIVIWGIGWAFVAAAAFFSVYTLMLAAMRVSTEPEKREQGSMVTEMVEGLTYIMGHGGIRLQLTILTVVGMVAKPVIDLLPGFAGQVFELGAEGLAMLLSLHGMGATVGAIWLASRASGLEGMTMISIFALLFMSLVLMAFVATDVFWVALVFAGLMGFAFIVLNVANQTLIQSAVDPSLRGRVISVYGLILQGMPALGALLIGTIAEHIGLRLPVFVGGVICLGAWFCAWRRRGALKLSLETEPVRAGGSGAR